MSTEKFRSMILAKAASNVKHIVLPEGTVPRMIEAAKMVTTDKTAKVTLLGDVDKITSGLKAIGAPIEKIGIIEKRIESRTRLSSSIALATRENAVSPRCSITAARACIWN